MAWTALVATAVGAAVLTTPPVAVGQAAQKTAAPRALIMLDAKPERLPERPRVRVQAQADAPGLHLQYRRGGDWMTWRTLSVQEQQMIRARVPVERTSRVWRARAVSPESATQGRASKPGGKKQPTATPTPTPTTSPTPTPTPTTSPSPTLPPVSPTPTTSPSTAVKPLKDRVLLGNWVPGSTTNASLFDANETQVGGKLDIVSLFYGFGDWFPSSREVALSDGGRRTMLLSWDMGNSRYSEWANGKHDDYLRIIGQQAAKYPYPVYVRPWPEMNGDWQPFMPDATGSRPAGGTPTEFIAAWRHVVTKVRAAGGTNIKWVFNPYAATYAGTADVRQLWPGKAYVDVLGIDGYNWGGGPQGPTTSFVDVFTPMYNILTGLDPDLPVWVCEVSSKEPSVNDGAPIDPSYTKGDWIRAAFNTTSFPRMTAVVWFDERKERDWRTDSSASSLAAFREVVAARAARN